MSYVSVVICYVFFFFFSSRRRHTRLQGDWSSDVCSSDLLSSLPLSDLPSQPPRFERLLSPPKATQPAGYVITSANSNCATVKGSATRCLMGISVGGTSVWLHVRTTGASRESPTVFVEVTIAAYCLPALWPAPHTVGWRSRAFATQPSKCHACEPVTCVGVSY